MPRVQGRGAGLGNELIPWARAFLAAQLVNATCLPPAFGMNSRKYWRHFGTPRYDWLSHKAFEHMLPCIAFTETDYNEFGGGDVVDAFKAFAKSHKLNERAAYLVTTEGLWGGYRHIAAARDFVHTTLYQSRFAARNLLAMRSDIDPDKVTVGMHVRLGDFGKTPTDLSGYKGQFNLALPLQWYKNIANSIQRQLGDSVQFLVVSDGTREQLQPLMHGLKTITTSHLEDTDCSDLLALADADLLVCSVSSYSSMAAYLSKAPYLWFEPQLQKHVEGCYSIWGHEHMQLQPTGATAQSRQQHQKSWPALTRKSRGVPIDMNGEVSVSLLERIISDKQSRAIQSDLIQYGVTPIQILDGE